MAMSSTGTGESGASELGPASADPGRHYRNGTSELERKMQAMMAFASAGEETHVDQGEDNVEEVEEEVTQSPLASLPVELLERCLQYAVLSSDQEARESSALPAASSSRRRFEHRIRARQAANLCLVCRQFDAWVRPLLYRAPLIRRARQFGRTLSSGNPWLRSLVRDATLETPIWSNQNENDVVTIFLAIRKSCQRLSVGPNEAPLLPYLFQGQEEEEMEKEDGKDVDHTAALKVLRVSWRPDETEEDESGTALRRLFLHQDQLAVSSSGKRSIPIEQLEIDVLSTWQVEQVFDHIFELLPQLHTLRITLPYAYLQVHASRSGFMRHRWPVSGWSWEGRDLNNNMAERHEVNSELASQLLSVATAAAPPANFADSTTTISTDTSQERRDPSDVVAEMTPMAPCPAHQIRAWLVRFLVNSHKNDMLLFRALAPPMALEKSWSTRASAAALCLGASLERALCPSRRGITTTALSSSLLEGDETMSTEDARRARETEALAKRALGDQSAILFPSQAFAQEGPAEYWKRVQDEAQRAWEEALPVELGGLGRVQAHIQTRRYEGILGSPNVAEKWSEEELDEESVEVRAFVCLRWPQASEAFFHYNALI